ncbi:MAG: hypothetical protein ACJ77L_08030 [Solirubrobacteraceae bacterium]
MDASGEIREFLTSGRARMERGKLTGVSDTVLDALARALTLDEAERSHLFDLARAAQPTPPARGRRRRGSESDRACSASWTP